MSEDELPTPKVRRTNCMRKHWKVIDGMLVFDGSRKGDNICTVKDYGNFEMLVDWKIETAATVGFTSAARRRSKSGTPTSRRECKIGCQKGSGALWNNENPRAFSTRASG